MMKRIHSDDFWQQLYYIRLRKNTKMPADSWGGYDQDFEKADKVYRWEDLGSKYRYGYIGHTKYDLAVIDIDLYKDGAPDVEDITIFDPDGNGTLLIQTPGGGFHVPFLTVLEQNATMRSTTAGIDIKGEAAKGHVVLPRHNSKYEILNDAPVPVFDQSEADQVVKVDGEPVMMFYQTTSNYDYDAKPLGFSLFPYLNRFGEDYRPETRHPHPLHGSDTESNFLIDKGAETWRCWRHEVTGNMLHLLGIELGYWNCGDWLTMDRDTKKQYLTELHSIADRKGYIGEPKNNVWTTI